MGNGAQLAQLPHGKFTRLFFFFIPDRFCLLVFSLFELLIEHFGRSLCAFVWTPPELNNLCFFSTEFF